MANVDCTDSFAKVVSRGILTGQITNVVLSFALVSNGFGLTGVAVALLAGDAIAMAYVAKKYLSSSERSRSFSPVFKDVGKFLSQAGRIINSGIPVASGAALISVKVWVIYQILGSTGGADAMTLYAICMACLSVVSMCIAGCNGAMMPIIGMLYGEKDFSGVRILVKYVLKFAMTLSGIFVAYSEAVAVMKSNGIAENIYLKVGVALEEMTLNIAKLNAGRKIDVDLRIKRGDDKITIAFRDNGKIFNPLEYAVAEEENLHTDGIMLLKNLASAIEYNRVLALNQILVEI